MCQHNSTYCSAPDIKVPHGRTESLLDYKRRMKGQFVVETVISSDYPGVERCEVLLKYTCRPHDVTSHKT
jgi:hypothetical protein